MLPLLYRNTKLLLHKLLSSHLHHLQTHFSRASSTTMAEQPSLFTISYLINSCGLSPQAALSTSRRVRLKNSTQQPDSVLKFLKTHGFNNTQISNLIVFRPRFLLSNPISTLQPKMQFFQTLGLSNAQLVQLIDSNPHILYRGLHAQLIPSIDFLRSLLQSDENVANALKRSRWLLTSDLKKVIGPNITLLEESRMPNSLITKMVMLEPATVTQKTQALREIIGRVESFGFERGSHKFMVAILAMSSMNKLTWATKIELLKSLGWSEEDVLLAFRRCPGYIRCSEKKFRSMMDFYTKKMRWNPFFLSRYPKILTFSLKNRVIPRSRVWEILRSKELVQENEFIAMLNLGGEFGWRRIFGEVCEEI
ncbi:hypothetical protein ACLOJK_000460 [Asimina triloba]